LSYFEFVVFRKRARVSLRRQMHDPQGALFVWSTRSSF
jgi:hypothetical protein